MKNDALRASTVGNQSMLRRILVVLAVLLVYRVGCSIPVPGVGKDLAALAPSANGVNLFNLFSGGPLTQASIFALGVTPFVTAAIAMQLLESIVPAIKEAKRAGRSGVERINRITRAIGIFLAVTQGIAAAFTLSALSNSAGLQLGLFPVTSWSTVSLFVVVTTVGFLALLWLAEIITKYGLGNGVTVLLLASVLSSVWEISRGLFIGKGITTLLVVFAVLLVLSGLIVVGTRAERRLPTVQASRFDLDTAHLSYLPFRLLHAGVAPIIFAVSVLTVGSFVINLTGVEWLKTAVNDVSSWAYMGILAVLVVAFARLYERTSADPVEIANDLIRDSRFIPGVRPGWPTVKVIEDTSLRLMVAALVLLIPIALMQSIGVRFFDLAVLPLAGTSLLIVVSGSLDIIRQARSVRSLYAYEDIVR